MTGGLPRVVDEKRFCRSRIDEHVDRDRVDGRASRQRDRRSGNTDVGRDKPELPAYRDERVTVPHQKPVAKLAELAALGPAAAGVIEAAEHPVAAVRSFEQQHAVAFRGIRRLQDVQVGREMDAAIRGARRVFEIDDAGVVRRGRIERKFDAAD